MKAFTYIFIFSLSIFSFAADNWPQFRGNSKHSGSVKFKISSQVQESWRLKFTKRIQAWDDPLNNDLMTYDRIFEPIIYKGLMFIPFNDRDKVIAVDIKTGKTKWTYFTNGPVRFAPVASEGKVYFVSDDGYLYCVNAETGKLAWKVSGAPGARKSLGNKRVISSWPARGGAVVRNGRVYFTASIWPFMGTFIYCLNAKTGAKVWVNDGSSQNYQRQPHGALAFAGVAPQGQLVATDKYLIVPGGRSIPAVFDITSGKELYFHHAKYSKGLGGSFVVADNEHFYVHTREKGVAMFKLSNGNFTGYKFQEPVLSDKIYSYDGKSLVCLDQKFRYIRLVCKSNLTNQKFVAAAEINLIEKGRFQKRRSWKVQTSSYQPSRRKTYDTKNLMDKKEKTVWRSKNAKFPHYITIDTGKQISADSLLYTPVPKLDKGTIKDYAIEISKDGKKWQKISEGEFVNKKTKSRFLDSLKLWSIKAEKPKDMIRCKDYLFVANSKGISVINLSGKAKLMKTIKAPDNIERLLAADGRLFAITLDGQIISFAKNEKAKTISEKFNTPQPAGKKFASMLKKATRTKGYAFYYGLDSMADLLSLVAESQYQIIVVEPNKEKVASFRKQLDKLGLYGNRVTVHQGTPSSYAPPSYIAHFAVIGKDHQALLNAKEFGEIYRSLRPYGGLLWVQSSKSSLKDKIKFQNLYNLTIDKANDGFYVTKKGAVKGAANWTNQYGSMANTVKSDDSAVQLPLGVLWFGW